MQEGPSTKQDHPNQGDPWSVPSSSDGSQIDTRSCRQSQRNGSGSLACPYCTAVMAGNLVCQANRSKSSAALGARQTVGQREMRDRSHSRDNGKRRDERHPLFQVGNHES